MLGAIPPPLMPPSLPPPPPAPARPNKPPRPKSPHIIGLAPAASATGLFGVVVLFAVDFSASMLGITLACAKTTPDVEIPSLTAWFSSRVTLSSISLSKAPGFSASVTSSCLAAAAALILGRLFFIAVAGVVLFVALDMIDYSKLLPTGAAHQLHKFLSWIDSADDGCKGEGGGSFIELLHWGST